MEAVAPARGVSYKRNSPLSVCETTNSHSFDRKCILRLIWIFVTTAALLLATFTLRATTPESIDGYTVAQLESLLGPPSNVAEIKGKSGGTLEFWQYKTPKGVVQLAIVDGRVALVPPAEPHNHVCNGETGRQLARESQKLQKSGKKHEAAVCLSKCLHLERRHEPCARLFNQVVHDVNEDIVARYNQSSPDDLFAFKSLAEEVLEIQPESETARKALADTHSKITNSKMELVRSLAEVRNTADRRKAIASAETQANRGALEEAFETVAPHMNEINVANESERLSSLVTAGLMRRSSIAHSFAEMQSIQELSASWASALSEGDSAKIQKAQGEGLNRILRAEAGTVLSGTGAAGARVLQQELLRQAPMIAASWRTLPWGRLGIEDPLVGVAIKMDSETCNGAGRKIQEQFIKGLPDSLEAVMPSSPSIRIEIQDLQCLIDTNVLGEQAINSTYVATYQQIANSRYVQLQSLIDAAEAEYDEIKLRNSLNPPDNGWIAAAQALLAGTAKSKVDNLRRELQATPPYLSEPVRLQYTPFRSLHRKSITASATVLVHDQLSDVIVSQYVESIEQSESSGVHGALDGDSQGLINEAPSFPADSVLAEKVLRKFTDELHPALHQGLERIFLERAKKNRDAVTMVGNVLIARDMQANSTLASGIYEKLPRLDSLSAQKLSLASVSTLRTALLALPSPSARTNNDRQPSRTSGSAWQVLMEGVVTIQTSTGSGSGFFVTSRGDIVTNAHVVEGAGKITIRTQEGETFLAKVVEISIKYDLALLHVSFEPSIVLSLDDSGSPDLGIDVYAMGAPSGLQGTVTKGIVSGLRSLDGVSYVQIDAPINPGNSGGPVVTGKGKVIGVATWKTLATEGIGFAVSSSEVLKVFGDSIR